MCSNIESLVDHKFTFLMAVYHLIVLYEELEVIAPYNFYGNTHLTVIGEPHVPA